MKPIPIFIGVLLIVATGFVAAAVLPVAQSAVVMMPTGTSGSSSSTSDAYVPSSVMLAAAQAGAKPPASPASAPAQTAAPKRPVSQAVSRPAVRPSVPPATSSSLSAPPPPAAATSTASTTAGQTGGQVCNTSLIGSSGYDAYDMITLSACQKLNALYAAGKAAGNVGDLYDNRDGLHVNLCVDWTPNPECPQDHRLFPQHDWLFSGSAGRATSPQARPTIGQASWSGLTMGDTKYSIPHDMYRTQAGADELYNLYVSNNLYVYPSLADDSFAGSPYDVSTLADPTRLDAATENIANTPYVIASKRICACGADSLRVHDASGSDLPFVELGFAGLAAFKPEVKKALIARGMLMSTLEALIRYSYRDVSSDAAYLSSDSQRSMYMAHYLPGGSIKPAFSVDKLVDMASGMTLDDVPPFVKLAVVSETFGGDEHLFTTPGSIARSVLYNAPARTITVSADQSADVDGTTSGHIFVWRVLQGDPSLVTIDVDPQDTGKATITFASSDSTERIDVGVFVKKQNGAYYSVPGIVSEYVHR